MLYIGYYIGLLAGVLLGVIGCNMWRSHGVLKIDKSDDEKDTYLFEIDDLSKIDKSKWIRLRIEKK